MPRTKRTTITDEQRREMDAQSRIRMNVTVLGFTRAVEAYGDKLIAAFNTYFTTPTNEQWAVVQEAAYEYQYTRKLDDEEHARRVEAGL
jgi:hypothetical protein